MKNQFVPYELAVKLKELGFKRTCLAEYIDGIFYLSTSLNNKKQVLTTASAPLWHQAFDWIFKKFNCDWKIYIGTLFITIEFTINNKYYKISELTKQACLEKLIEIIS